MENRVSQYRWFTLFSLVFAGEMIFSLPFHIARFFRPTMLEVFHLTHTRLGDVIAMYGILAMLSYFPGGMLADRFTARKLMSVSLVATAAGGFYLLLIPGFSGLLFIFGYWGITTILLFWAAMIKATREWGGKPAQGIAFGLLDGGRGLVAAGAATLAVALLGFYLPQQVENADPLQQRAALRAVILFYSVLTMLAAVLVWVLVPDDKKYRGLKQSRPFSGLGKVIGSRVVWLQALIVISAYCGYKGLDFYSLYGIESLNMNELTSAQFITYASYLRALGAIGAGFLVDRFSASRIISIAFFMALVGYLFLGFMEPADRYFQLIIANLIVTFIAVYALRGIYFALLEETKVKAELTGTAVGLISVIGYTPDIFFNSIAGRILDASPGLQGFQHYFIFLACFGLVGLVASLILGKMVRK